jgi:hypothetical protein
MHISHVNLLCTRTRHPSQMESFVPNTQMLFFFLIPLVMLETGCAIIKEVKYCTSVLRYRPFRMALDANIKFDIK